MPIATKPPFGGSPIDLGRLLEKARMEFELFRDLPRNRALKQLVRDSHDEHEQTIKYALTKVQQKEFQRQALTDGDKVLLRRIDVRRSEIGIAGLVRELLAEAKPRPFVVPADAAEHVKTPRFPLALAHLWGLAASEPQDPEKKP